MFGTSGSTSDGDYRDFTMVIDRDAIRNRPPVNGNAQASSSKAVLPRPTSKANDPLAEFYDQAKRDRDSEVCTLPAHHASFLTFRLGAVDPTNQPRYGAR